MSLKSPTPIEKRIDGMRVIVRSNEDEPLLIGNFKGMWDIGIGFTCVQDDDGKEHICGGITVPWSEPLEKLLETLTPQEQYILLSDLVNFQRVIDQKVRNKVKND